MFLSCLGWDDVGYNFLIGEDGRVYIGRGWMVQGAHTRGYNIVGNGFCVIGNYMNRVPHPRALMAVKRIIQCGVENVTLIILLQNCYEFGEALLLLNLPCANYAVNM